jgi:hypothetical protein
VQVPEGWKLVPVEPTQEMLQAALNASRANAACGMSLMLTDGCELWAASEVYRVMLAAAPSAPVAHEAGAQGSSCEHESEMQYEIQLPDGTYTHLTVYGSERDLKRLGSRLDFFHSREAQLRALLSATAPSAPATVATEAAASVKDSLTAEAVAQGGGLDDGRLWSFLCDVLDSGRCLGDFYRFKEGYHIARDAKACALVNDLRALLSAPLAASGWQPIETAPKDGTRILLAKIGATNAVPGLGIKAREPHVWWACTGHWSEKWKNWNDGIEPCGLAGPNYWHPLPPPPAIANQSCDCGQVGCVGKCVMGGPDAIANQESSND